MNPLDHVRESIRAAVARANPIDEARRSIELIAETSVRYADGSGEPSIHVIDEMGERRTKTEAGRTVDFSVDDLIAEIKTKHPTLFRRGSPSAAAASPTVAAASAAQSVSPAPVAAAPPAAPAPSPAAAPGVEASRDWLVIGGSAPPVAPAAQVYVAPAPAMQVPAAAIEPPAPDLPRAPRVEGASDTPKAQGWFRMLGNAGPVIRIASNGMASRLSGLATGIRGRRELPAGVGMAGEGLRRVAGPVLRASAALVLLLIGGSVVYGLGSLALRSDDPPARTAAVTAPREPTTTGSIAPARPAAEPANVARANDNGPVRGVPEVLDTATLSIHGKVVRLFGIEWVRGAGEPADLASYIRGREVTCEPAKPGATTYRCNVEGQDLSKVVLFNGGGRATSEASADLQAAEAHAKSSRAGLWAKGG